MADTCAKRISVVRSRNISKITGPDGQTVSYRTDGNGDLTGVTGVTDANGNPGTLGDPPGPLQGIGDDIRPGGGSATVSTHRFVCVAAAAGSTN
jgi:hypothetical protein